MAGLERELAGDEDEAARHDALGVRRALKRGRRRLGAYDVLLLHRSSDQVVCGRAACGERGAESLEDGVEHVLGVVSLEQPDVERQTGSLREAAQEVADHVGGEAADAGLGEIDVRDDERLVARLERDEGERLAVGHRSRAVALAHAARGDGGRSACAERRACGGDLRRRDAGLDLQREIETRVAGKQLDEVVEDGDAGLDAHARGGRERRPGRAETRRPQTSTRSIRAPSERRRSSTRSYPRSI